MAAFLPPDQQQKEKRLAKKVLPTKWQLKRDKTMAVLKIHKDSVADPF